MSNRNNRLGRPILVHTRRETDRKGFKIFVRGIKRRPAKLENGLPATSTGYRLLEKGE